MFFNFPDCFIGTLMSAEGISNISKQQHSTMGSPLPNRHIRYHAPYLHPRAPLRLAHSHVPQMARLSRRRPFSSLDSTSDVHQLYGHSNPNGSPSTLHDQLRHQTKPDSSLAIFPANSPVSSARIRLGRTSSLSRALTICGKRSLGEA